MCRSSNDSGGKRRCPCDNGSVRRDRQNLANAVKRAEVSSDGRHVEPAETDESSREKADRAIAEVVKDVEHYKGVIKAFQQKRASFGSLREWILDGREDTPENHALGMEKRGSEVRAIGEIVAARAEAIHGLDIEEEKRKIEESKERDTKRMRELDAPLRERSMFFVETCEKHGVVLDFKADNKEIVKGFEPDERAKYEELTKQYSLNSAEIREIQNRMSATRKGEDENTIGLLRKISAANRQAVAEIREVGNEPVVFNANLRKDRERIVAQFNREISSVFPDEWIRKSNEMGELGIRRTATRAHYKVVGEEDGIYIYTVKHKPVEGDDRHVGWRERLDESGNPTGVWEGPGRESIPLFEKAIGREKKKFNEDGTPKGAGWRRGRVGYIQRSTGDTILKEEWVRDVPKDAKRIKEQLAGIGTINFADNCSEKEQDATVVHEFSHRVEEAYPAIPQFEQWWIAKRTTNEDGTRHKLYAYTTTSNGRLVVSRNEKLRSDDFVEAYIGKEYSSPRFHELLSIGSEALFKGEYGGFEGLGHAKSDRDTKAYILGMYASI